MNPWFISSAQNTEMTFYSPDVVGVAGIRASFGIPRGPLHHYSSALSARFCAKVAFVLAVGSSVLSREQ